MAEKILCACGATISSGAYDSHIGGRGHAMAMQRATMQGANVVDAPDPLAEAPGAVPPARTPEVVNPTSEPPASPPEPKPVHPHREQIIIEDQPPARPERPIPAAMDGEPDDPPYPSAFVIGDDSDDLTPRIKEGQGADPIFGTTPEPEAAVVDRAIAIDPAVAASRRNNTVDAFGSEGASSPVAPAEAFSNRPRRVNARPQHVQEGVNGEFVAAEGDKPAPVTRAQRKAVPFEETDTVTDPISLALGGVRYATPYTFDDEAMQLRDFNGHRFRFSRYYYDQNVAVDIFEDTPSNRAIAAERSRKLAEYNFDLQSAEKIGYVPIELNAELAYEDAAAALRGRILRFIEREKAFQ